MALETAADRLARERYARLVTALVGRLERERARLLEEDDRLVALHLQPLDSRLRKLEEVE